LDRFFDLRNSYLLHFLLHLVYVEELILSDGSLESGEIGAGRSKRFNVPPRGVDEGDRFADMLPLKRAGRRRRVRAEADEAEKIETDGGKVKLLKLRGRRRSLHRYCRCRVPEIASSPASPKRS
jgi:hypothetical protein